MSVTDLDPTLLLTALFLFLVSAVSLQLLATKGPLRRWSLWANTLLVAALALLNGIGTILLLRQLVPSGPWFGLLCPALLLPGIIFFAGYFYLSFSARLRWTSKNADKKN